MSELAVEDRKDVLLEPREDFVLVEA